MKLTECIPFTVMLVHGGVCVKPGVVDILSIMLPRPELQKTSLAVEWVEVYIDTALTNESYWSAPVNRTVVFYNRGCLELHQLVI